MNTISLSKVVIVIFLLTGVTILFSNCKQQEEVVSSTGGGGGQTTEKSLVSGQVVHKTTGLPLDSALVRILGTTLNLVYVSDAQGRFSFEVQLTQDENVTIITYRENFMPDTASATIVVGEALNLPLIQMTELASNNSGPTGDPVSIFLASISATTIGVKESGSEETSRLTFVVQDSAGRPVDIEHSVTVQFQLGGGPGGGEFLSPFSVPTNATGQASVNLTSGTKAGAVQIIATINVNGNSISSLPVGITIHGGLPDLAHFSISPELLNFPGYNIFGLENTIVAFVGDKYANPVRPETAVYFTSTGGIIEGSALTNELGIGDVSLISAEPRPFHQTLGAGFATITASTIDENSQTISTEAIVLFSGVPQVSVTPTSIDVQNGGSQGFSFFVGDQNGNPLAGGTAITVTLEGDDSGIQGDLDFTLPDTQSPAWTQFSFLVYDKADTVIAVNPATVRIETTGPNGGGFVTISGVVR